MIKLFRICALLFCSVSLGHVHTPEYWHKEIDEIISKVDLFSSKHEMLIWSHLVGSNKDLEQKHELYKIGIKGIIRLRIIKRFKTLKQYHPIYNKY